MTDLESRQHTVANLARRMDLSQTRYAGSMRLAGPLDDLSTTARKTDMPVADTGERTVGAASSKFVNDLRAQWWDPDVKLLINEINPDEPGLLTLSVRHEEFIKRIPDPLLGVMVHIHVRPLYKGSELIERVGYSYEYFAPENDTDHGRGRLMVEVADVVDVPALGVAVQRINDRPGWTWNTDAAIAPESGEPVILLRINVRGVPLDPN